MKHYVLLRHLRVENANAISGMTWGFPAPSNFLGYIHALSRKLQARFGEQVSLGGVGIICHAHQVHTQRPSGFEHVFALTRNPLTKDGKTAPFNEEGRMHMTVSLLVECAFDVLDLPLGDALPEQRIETFQQLLAEMAMSQRLAGGTIVNVPTARWWSLDAASEDGQRVFRQQMLRLIPGFVLLDRSELLVQHHQTRLQDHPNSELLDSWLDFVALGQQPDPIGLEAGDMPIEGQTKAEWHYQNKPASGYLVPLVVGYQGISELFDAGVVARTRDNSVPFRFVESAYSIGEWCSPHRIRTPEQLLWRYQQQGNAYSCRITDSATSNQTSLLPTDSSDEPISIEEIDTTLAGFDF
jgi:CRISPR-associated protein Csy2